MADAHAEHVGRATFGQVRAIIRRKLRRVEPQEENFLNIYPMMDMMTILLVFLIMQFASGGAEIVQTNELQIPYSVSSVAAVEAVTLQISRTQVAVEGALVMNLRNGTVDPQHKQGGGTGFLITPLLRIMEQHATRLKLIGQRNTARPFKGSVRIIADRRTPYRTLTEVIYTLGQAEFRELHFVLLEGSG